jgi:hypothetical protein
MEPTMQEQLSHWMGTPRAAGFVAGSWCCAALALAVQGHSSDALWGAALLRWLASDGVGPGALPLAIAGAVAAFHAIRIREAQGTCCREWVDAAWSLGLIAAGMAAWTWALRYEPFADPVSASRRLAALAGLGALLTGCAVTLAVAIAGRSDHEAPRAPRVLRRSYEAIS